MPKGVSLSIMANLTWRCNYDNCPYCWQLAAFGRRKEYPAGPHPWTEWRDALLRYPPAVVDLLGGETLLFPGIYHLAASLYPHHRWAISSNLSSHTWFDFVNRPLPGCVGWTASWHPTGRLLPEEFLRRCKALLGVGYPVNVNIIESAYKAQEFADVFRRNGLHVEVNPYEDVRDTMLVSDKPLRCKGGSTHITIDPEGWAYPCLTKLRREDRNHHRLGNIFDGTFRLGSEQRGCRVYCEEYYILRPRHAQGEVWNLYVQEDTL
jgi:MoaA/NifB/PqqE/SkfB family radical SAM enzyme